MDLVVHTPGLGASFNVPTIYTFAAPPLTKVSRGPCRERGTPYKSSCRVILTGLIASPVYQAKAVCKRLRRSWLSCFKSFAPPKKKKGVGEIPVASS